MLLSVTQVSVILPFANTASMMVFALGSDGALPSAVNTTNAEGAVALHMAVAAGNKPLAELLLQAGSGV